MRLGWSTDFLVIDGEAPAALAMEQIEAATAAWIVIVRGGGYRYVFNRKEVRQRLRELGIPDVALSGRLVDALALHEPESSTVVDHSAQLAPPDLSWRQGMRSPSIFRYVEVDAAGQPLAVGGADVGQVARMRSSDFKSARPPEPAAAAGLAAAPAAVDDEGTSPVRFPSIEPVGAVRPGAPITLEIDLRREETPGTFGGVSLPAQAGDWKTIELAVALQSPSIDFDPGTKTLTIRRNDSTLAARISGRVRPGVPAGSEIEVQARFCHGIRYCGSAFRRLRVGSAGDSAGGGSAPAVASSVVTDAANGAVQVDILAAPPDVTVFITLSDPAAPGKMHWRVVTPPFDGLPAELDGFIDLGRDPQAEAAALFKQFANLERGKHKEAIEGFGEQLWQRAPRQFQAAYWALCDHYQRPLALQFVSDDPHLPWELMSPYRDGEVHGPLALRHAVARWIGKLQGWMRNRLTIGALVAVAPHYRSASTQLSLAEGTAERLVSTLGARRLAGTRQALLDLLEKPPAEPVGVLYFTGHGAFNGADADASAIKLEDANLFAREVERQKVQLGARHGTMVFLNACEVGATASVLGGVGGWAQAFLAREFRAFIAPLWAIDEEDAAQATQELMASIIQQRQPIGAAMRDLRQKYGDISPTFYSYLVYGDVNAQLAPGSPG